MLRSCSMATDVKRRAGMITVGPPDGPQVKIPAAYTIDVTGEAPYDLRLDVAWDPDLGRHTLHELTITEQPDGVYVRMSQINQIALAEIAERCLVADVLGGPDGWEKMSVSKPFVFALVCDALNVEEARQKLGVNGTGLPFDSLCAVERSNDGRTNPMVNAGAIATTSLVPGATVEAKWRFIHDGLSAFAGRTLSLNTEVVHLRVPDQSSKPEHCPAPAESRSNLLRPGPDHPTCTPGNAR